MSRSRLDLDQL